MDFKNLERIFNAQVKNPYMALTIVLSVIITGFVISNTTKGQIPNIKQQPTAIKKEAPPLKNDYKPYVPPKPTNTARQQEAERQKEQVRKKGSNKLLAEACAEQRVEQMLKAPRTAKHPWTGAKVAELSSNKYMVSSYVDAENSFGAMLRQNYICIVEISGIDILGNDDCKVECEFE